MYTALLLGASGLVGGQLLRQLLADGECGRVTALLRRPLGISDPRLTEVVADLARPETYQAAVGADHVFCCLGTTIKKAGSQAAFRVVDLEYPLSVARAAAAGGAGEYLIVTAVGADPDSAIFYNRIKGEVEQALRALSFPRGVKIFRPSMLLGDRGEPRPLERAAAALMKATAPLFGGGLARYRAIDAAQVARAMWRAARTEPAETRVYEGQELFALAAR